MLDYTESWLLSVVPLRMKENTHLQIKHYAFIKNVATIPGVLLRLAKEVSGIVGHRRGLQTRPVC